MANDTNALRERIAELEAARLAYASEFPSGPDGQPDVGSIHANIRALKDALREIGEVAAAAIADSRSSTFFAALTKIRALSDTPTD